MHTDDKYEEELSNVVAQLEKDGRKIQVLGHVVNGKLELDQASLQELAAKFPNSKLAFVAVNAPFDPVRHID
ncbi:hypothetical protein WMF30_22085 [Sorangium sp. So ce134]